ncbi:MAG TPA: ATP-binding protein [Terriglobales bacterium]|nr:ATP-binding protein [Terriglobales bacterium]
MTLSRRRYWLAITGFIILVHLMVSLGVKWGHLERQYWLTAFGNLLQTALLAAVLAAMLLNVIGTRGRRRAFWSLMALGSGLWLTAQLLWTWYEIVRRTEVPNPFVADVVVFLHIVPMMGALAVRPHLPGSQSRQRLGYIDFLLLLLWWLYLYLILVIPWQYVKFDEALYGFSFNLLYDVEKLVLTVGAGWLWLTTQGMWKRVYGHLFGATALYELGSHWVNIAIDAKAYYTGSLYDVPLVASMAWFVWIGLLAQKLAPGVPAEEEGRHQAMWPAKLAMGAVFSIPLLIFWSVFISTAPQMVRDFRLLVSLGAFVVFCLLVFWRQHTLDRELLRLLRTSEESLARQKMLQDELVRSAKLAAMGQLVAGAAHEINNPLTAILGYADLLESNPALSEQERSLADKIRRQARRTRELVSNLISFARQSPAEKKRVDVNAAIASAVKMRQSQLAKQNIVLEMHLKSELPAVMADESHLFQVFSHLINNAADAMAAGGGGPLTIRTSRDGKDVVMEFSDAGPGVADPQRVFDPFYTTKPVGKGTGLGLSAAYGIVAEHGGQIVCANRPQGGATFIVRLPAAPDVAPPPAAAAGAANRAPVTH